mgnify:CR=1 FL=1
MLARDIMSKSLVTVGRGDSLARVARAMLGAGVSAVPVVDTAFRPLGVISEWDLIGQHAPERAAQLDHWLSRLAEGQSLSNEYVKIVEPSARTAGEVMTSPVITVSADADLTEIAGILGERRMKRVFVVDGERLVGVVSRTDLARALMLRAASRPSRRPVETSAADATGVPPVAPPRDVPETGVSAATFRRLVAAHEEAKRAAASREQAAREAARQALVAKLAAERLSESEWRTLVEHAQAAAERGEKDFLLIRFPSALCDDGGRMINAPDPNWPTSLRGPAADVYERWRDELKPAGFGLLARILEFPGGYPGDAGIILTWGG